jgi:uncharacterized protein YuzE
MYFMEVGRIEMNIEYNNKTDMLYMRMDNEEHTIINKRITDDIVLDIDEAGKIIGIEIMDASKNMNLKGILPVNYEIAG